MFKNKTVWLVFAIAIIVRIYNLASLPNGFFVEEMTNTYVGRFILLHGRDIYGHLFPLLYFDKFGDYPPVLPLYLSGLSTFIFGVNEFAGRFPIALMGALLVFPMYFISELIFEDKRVSFFVAFTTALLPWNVVLSRTTAEGVIAETVLAWAILLFFKAILKNNRKKLIISFSLFLLTYFLYPSLRVLVPLIFVFFPILLINEKTKLKKITIFAAIFFVLLTALISRTTWGRARFNQTSIISSPIITDSINLRNRIMGDQEGGHILEARIFHNKLTGYFREFMYQYFNYFSPRYLFMESGGQYRYYNVADQGLLFIALFPLLVCAFLKVNKKPMDIYTKFFAYLLVVSPIPAALTVDFTPHAHRSMFMTIPLIIIAGYGMHSIINLRWKFINPVLVCSVLVLLEFTYFWHQYSVHADKFQSILRNDGEKEITHYVIDHEKNYKNIIMPSDQRLGMYYLFYTNNFSSSLIGQFKSELRLPNVDNITFFDDPCPTKFVDKKMITNKTLVVENGTCDAPGGFKEVGYIVRKDQTIAYRMYNLSQ